MRGIQVIVNFVVHGFRESQPVHVVVDPVLSNVLRPHQREVFNITGSEHDVLCKLVQAFILFYIFSSHAMVRFYYFLDIFIRTQLYMSFEDHLYIVLSMSR